MFIVLTETITTIAVKSIRTIWRTVKVNRKPGIQRHLASFTLCLLPYPLSFLGAATQAKTPEHNTAIIARINAHR